MLEKLRKVNPEHTIFTLEDEAFNRYGRLVEGYDFSELEDFMLNQAEMPIEGNVYYPSIGVMEKSKICADIQNSIYGGMDIQIGYCNGKNSTFNGVEYHKSSEINVAFTDCMMFLGSTTDIKNNTFSVEDAEVFFIKKGQAFEMYQTTLHLSPCKVTDDGFRVIIILPQGTNTLLETKKETADPESQLLLMKNKWVIAHPERKPLIDKGAYAGIIGNNIALKY
ncbi:MAG: DUF4867 family protein [Anaerotignaceae bacterium]